MVRVRFSILTSFVMLFSLFGSIPAQSSFVAIDECKLKYNFASPTSPISIGFPRVTEGVIPNYGSQRQLIIAVKFADADYNIENIGTRLEKAAKPGDVSRFFESVSYGRVKIEFDIYQEIITLSQPFDSYLGVNGPYSRDNNLNTAKMVEELRSVLQNKDKLPKYSALNVFLINKTPLQYTSQQALVGLGATFYPNHFYLPNLPDVSRTLMHEIGHLFGLIDTYAISENGREPENEVFFSLDLMTNSFQTLSSWNRWYLDWIIDSQVQCLEAELNNVEISLKALDSPGGLKMAVVKLSSTELLVIEARRGGKYDALINNSGITVHHLDMNKPPMQQALSVIPKGKWNKEELKNNRRFSANYDDYVAKAGEYIYYESNGVLIQNIGNSGESFQLKLSSGKEAVKNLALAQTKPIKSTITCIKGKTLKKVTAVNPKCPKGYKKK
jgi:hypothetical protein